MYKELTALKQKIQARIDVEPKEIIKPDIQSIQWNESEQSYVVYIDTATKIAGIHGEQWGNQIVNAQFKTVKEMVKYVTDYFYLDF